MKRPTILAFSSWYLPGFKAGGPIRAVANTVRHLRQLFRFRIVTRDRDLGDSAPFPGLTVRDWNETGEAKVMYLGPRDGSLGMLRSIVRDARPDLLYLNSFFDPVFTLRPLLLRRMGLISRQLPLIIAPRGELAHAALSMKEAKKKAFLRIAKASGLYSGAVWQAGSRSEAADIVRIFGNGIRVEIVPDLPPWTHPSGGNMNNRKKTAGHLRGVFLSRIAPIKNLDGALSILSDISGQVEFDIYGPVEDPLYWERCQRIIKRLPPNITVRYCGQIENSSVIGILSRYDLLFLPTRGESFGHVILEALLAGCPVLISDQTPWRGLEKKRAGWDVPLGDRGRFAAILRDLVSMDGEEYRQWSEEARRLAVSFCNDETLISATLALFSGALNSGRTA